MRTIKKSANQDRQHLIYPHVEPDMANKGVSHKLNNELTHVQGVPHQHRLDEFFTNKIPRQIMSN